MSNVLRFPEETAEQAAAAVERDICSGDISRIAPLVGQAKEQVREASGPARLAALERSALGARYRALMATGEYTCGEAVVLAAEKPWFSGPHCPGDVAKRIG